MWWHTRRNQISSFGETDESIEIGRGRQFSRLLVAEVCAISGSNAGYTMFRGSVKSTGYPLHSPVSPSLPLPCVTVCLHVSVGLYNVMRGYLYNSHVWTSLYTWGTVLLVISKVIIWLIGRSQCPRGLRCRFATARLLRLWVGIPPVAWMSVCCECCVLSGRCL